MGPIHAALFRQGIPQLGKAFVRFSLETVGLFSGAHFPVGYCEVERCVAIILVAFHSRFKGFDRLGVLFHFPVNDPKVIQAVRI